MYDSDDIIYALATPLANSAIALIRISGVGSIEAFAPLFSRPEALREASSHTLTHGYLIDPTSGNHIDEILVALFRDQRGYTGEESLELTLHGSLIVIEEALTLFGRFGMRSALPGEFTFRAFMQGKLDLTQAEAVHELIQSKSSVARSLALERLEGALFERIEYEKGRLLHEMAAIEVQLDYPEDELDENFPSPRSTVMEVKESLDTLLATYQTGRLYAQGAKVVIAGSTNAGKSTLFNLLLRQERSIVSDQHGTTRDFIEATVTLEGFPIRLYDTAGLRAIERDQVEREGINRTYRLLEQADLILFMLDISDPTPLDSEQQELLADERCLVICNKSDLEAATSFPKNSIVVSAKSGQGVDVLLAKIVQRLRREATVRSDEAVMIESQRQKRELQRAVEALTELLALEESAAPLDLLAVELQEALNALGTLTGEVASDDILEQIFSQFCVGK